MAEFKQRGRTHLADVSLVELERVGRSTFERVPSTFGFLEGAFDDLALITEHGYGDVGIGARTGHGSCLGRHDVLGF